eukprot:scaffold447_cov307-Pinguiococcus_pyrenoidosus.AAC.87
MQRRQSEREGEGRGSDPIDYWDAVWLRKQQRQPSYRREDLLCVLGISPAPSGNPRWSWPKPSGSSGRSH